MHKCVNNTVGNVYHLEQMVDNFFPYSQKKLGFDRPVTVVFQSDDENASRMLGKTAYYDPQAMEVVLYTDNRHPKDILRSLSHELVHHAQNCRGDFTGANNTEPGYAQKDPHMRKMEREAYTKGNLIFRDFEDLIKTGKINIEIDFSTSGEPKMSLKEWKNNELNTLLMKKWGLLKEGTAKERADEEGNRPSMAKDMDLDEGHEHGPECGCPDMEEGLQYRKEDDWGKSPAAFTGTEKEEEEAISHLKKGKALEEDSEGEETYHYGEDEGRDEYRLKHDRMSRRHRDRLKSDMEYDEDHERRRERGTHFREAQEEIEEGGKHNPAWGGPEERHFGDDADTYIGPAIALDPEAMAKKRAQVRSTPEYAGTSVKPRKGSRSAKHLRGAPRQEIKKISVREAKEITRRIIERIKKERN